MCGANKWIIRTTIIVDSFSKKGSLQFMMLDDTFSDSINNHGDRGSSFSAQ